MSAPKHLWSGDWRQDSETASEELQTRRTQATKSDQGAPQATLAQTGRSLSDRVAARARLLRLRKAPASEQSAPAAGGAPAAGAAPAAGRDAHSAPTERISVASAGAAPRPVRAPLIATSSDPARTAEPTSARTLRASTSPKPGATAPQRKRGPIREFLGRPGVRPVAIVALAALLIAGAAYGLTSALNSSSNSGNASSSNPGAGLSASAGSGGSAGAGSAGAAGGNGPGSPGASAGSSQYGGGSGAVPGAGNGSSGGSSGAGAAGAGSGSPSGQAGSGSQGGQAGSGSQSTQPGGTANPSPSSTGSAAWLGVDIDQLPFGGVVVVFVEPSSPAAAAGLEPGDVITQIDNRPIQSASDLHSALARLHAGDHVEISISRGSTLLTAQATLATRPAGVP